MNNNNKVICECDAHNVAIMCTKRQAKKILKHTPF